MTAYCQICGHFLILSLWEMNNDMKSCTIFFSACDYYDNVIDFTLKLVQITERYKKTQIENKLEDIKEDFK